MCGIFGALAHTAAALPAGGRTAETLRLLRHRGPDASGIHEAPGIVLAHTRLALLDLHERSNQPFRDPERRRGLVYNGEIYNFRELRPDLEREGAVFRASGDTEVVLAAFRYWGPETAVRRFEGMFALGLHDVEGRELVLARDRFGIKPLYLYDDGRLFLFASEPQALQPWVTLDPDDYTISCYLMGFGGPTRDHSFFRHVTIAPPGTVIRVRAGRPPAHERYFTFPSLWSPPRTSALRHGGARRAADELEAHPQESVRLQLASDAPVGVFVSGGVDSALLAAMARRVQPDIQLFHADVSGPDSDRAAAVELARHLRAPAVSVRRRYAARGVQRARDRASEFRGRPPHARGVPSGAAIRRPPADRHAGPRLPDCAVPRAAHAAAGGLSALGNRDGDTGGRRPARHGGHQPLHARLGASVHL
jgi:asparagine synthase (glutamine-hydrolysing)